MPPRNHIISKSYLSTLYTEYNIFGPSIFIRTNKNVRLYSNQQKTTVTSMKRKVVVSRTYYLKKFLIILMNNSFKIKLFNKNWVVHFVYLYRMDRQTERRFQNHETFSLYWNNSLFIYPEYWRVWVLWDKQYALKWTISTGTENTWNWNTLLMCSMEKALVITFKVRRAKSNKAIKDSNHETGDILFGVFFFLLLCLFYNNRVRKNEKPTEN